MYSHDAARGTEHREVDGGSLARFQHWFSRLASWVGTVSYAVRGMRCENGEEACTIRRDYYSMVGFLSLVIETRAGCVRRFTVSLCFALLFQRRNEENTNTTKVAMMASLVDKTEGQEIHESGCREKTSCWRFPCSVLCAQLACILVNIALIHPAPDLPLLHG